MRGVRGIGFDEVVLSCILLIMIGVLQRVITAY